ncbi:MAG: hypothetical protein IIC13_10465 [SAR324 cluster bacterium]|nr:hypothetical protein [SAR324 cluster bacterium]
MPWVNHPSIAFFPGGCLYLWLLAMAMDVVLLGGVYPIFRALWPPVAATIREE